MFYQQKVVKRLIHDNPIRAVRKSLTTLPNPTKKCGCSATSQGQFQPFIKERYLHKINSQAPKRPKSLSKRRTKGIVQDQNDLKVQKQFQRNLLRVEDKIRPHFLAEKIAGRRQGELQQVPKLIKEPVTADKPLLHPRIHKEQENSILQAFDKLDITFHTKKQLFFRHQLTSNQPPLQKGLQASADINKLYQGYKRLLQFKLNN